MIPQIDSVPVNIAAWLACLAFLVGLLNGLIRLSDRAKGKSALVDVKQPFEVTEATKFVRKEECVSRHRESEGRVALLEGQIAEMRTERKEENTLLHEKVNDVKERVAGLERETQQQNSWLSRIDAKIDQFGRRTDFHARP